MQKDQGHLFHDGYTGRMERGRKEEKGEGEKICKVKQTSKEKKQIKYPTRGDWLSMLYIAIQWNIIWP